jgi:hypothetical protein
MAMDEIIERIRGHLDELPGDEAPDDEVLEALRDPAELEKLLREGLDEHRERFDEALDDLRSG